MKILLITRLIMMSLVITFLLVSCRNEKPEELEIVWEDNKPVKLLIPKKLLGSIDPSLLRVYLMPAEGPAILGGIEPGDNSSGSILFRPLIPFTRGLSYRVAADSVTIGFIKIPPPVFSDVAEIVTVYPTVDTVPENLLKIYIEFSKPMKQGESLQHISLIKNGTDTLQSVFLDLQPELWNNERTLLTVWFDPGRIKRGLQPNLTMGPPLAKGNMYTFIVKQGWENEEGAEMQRSFFKEFVTSEYDNISPVPALWKIKTPVSGSKNTLDIEFNESLDFMLVKNAIRFINPAGADIPGKITVHPGETGLSFIPMMPWEKGDYYLTVESRLEDLAGNNLDHPFDNDITQKQNKNPGKSYKRLIRIE